MEPPSKVEEFLPSTQAKWALWVSLSLSGLLYALLVWLQADKLLPLAVAQKLSILLPPAALLLVGAIFVLYFVIKAHNSKTAELAKLKQAIIDHVPPPTETKKPKPPPPQFSGPHSWMG